MTTIAWDGETMAADSYSSGHKNPVTKLHRLPDGSVIGGAGYLEDILSAIQYFNIVCMGGALTKDTPKPKLRDDFGTLLRAFSDGTAELYHSQLVPIPVGRSYHAIGSGSDYAMAAMYLEEAAKEAVEVAAVFDLNTGGYIQTMRPE